MAAMAKAAYRGELAFSILAPLTAEEYGLAWRELLDLRAHRACVGRPMNAREWDAALVQLRALGNEAGYASTATIRRARQSVRSTYTGLWKEAKEAKDAAMQAAYARGRATLPTERD